MKRNMYSAEYEGVTVKITEKQLNRLYPYEVLELLIKRGLPIKSNFNSVGCLTNVSKIASLNCFKRTSKPNSINGNTFSIKLKPLWVI